jgi:hypothetical protein
MAEGRSGGTEGKRDLAGKASGIHPAFCQRGRGAIGNQRGMWQMLRGEIRRSKTDGKKLREPDGGAA